MTPIEQQLQDELALVVRRYRRLRLWSVVAAAWFVTGLAGWIACLSGWTAELPERVAAGLLGGAGLLLAFLGVILVRAFAPRPQWVAGRIERKFPELHSCLLAAIEQQPDLPDGRYGFLQSSVIRQALEHASCHTWRQVVSSRRMACAVLSNCAGLALLLAAVGATVLWTPPTATARSRPARRSAPASTEFTLTVEPGNTEIERGSSLLVLGRIEGDLPAEAQLHFQTKGAERVREAMTRSLDDPVFGARIPFVKESLEYQVEAGGRLSPLYQVTVFEYPRLERADVRLVYPAYTGLDPRLVQDVRTLSVVEGTELTLLCHLNKPVRRARFTEAKAASVVLAPLPEDPLVWTASFRAESSRRLKLELVDDAGRRNVQQSELNLQVVPNQPPTIKPVFPARDVEVSSLEELDLKGTVWDDFGILRTGISYALAGQGPVDLVLAEKAEGRQRHELATRLRLEDLHAAPDQLLSYYFWAEDHGPDGSVRRTSSDMYFAEVRPFEEIYRQGEAPPGGQQQGQGQGNGNSQEAQQLAQLQKEIINATWKVIRREIAEKLTTPFVEDVKQIAESQASVLEQAQALADRLKDDQSRQHAAAVLTSMKAAVSQLENAHTSPAREPLQPALDAEQAAYQALLKLRAREHEVVRQQQRQQASSAGSSESRSSRQQAQLDQLDLASEENRYETQRSAQSRNETPQDRETRQVLNRLRELAQRQHDLNDRLKDLQSALEEARTPERREEIRRQLKRLQEEEQQVLHDTDDLKSRMETAENMERMSDERQQLEQTREQVQRASEALEQQQVTQAAASGTRAEKEFEELRNEFRRRAAGRFNEEVRQMRDAARELDRREQQLAEQLTAAARPEAGQKSLRDDNRAEKLVEGLADQRQRLSGLVEQMRRTIQEAEQNEPLLSEKLYDAARHVQEQHVDRALEAASRSARQGLVTDAQQQERAAGRGIGQLREGVERAAESVLGDETESLRRARDELKQLTAELNQEIAQNSTDGKPLRAPRDRETADAERPEGARTGEHDPQTRPDGKQGERRKADQRPEDQAQTGQQQPGQQQPGQQQPDGRQPGARPGTPSPAGQPKPGQPTPGQPAQGQPAPGQRAQGQPTPGQPQAGERSPEGAQGTPQGGGNPRGAAVPAGPGGLRLDGETTQGAAAPITGDDFREWSDRLRDVEEMVSDPELRAEAARIRDRARAIRAEFKRHSEAPNWDVVRVNVAEPLVELADRVAEELLRRNSRQAVVSLGRDPVPPRYSEQTRRYYDQLGSGK